MDGNLEDELRLSGSGSADLIAGLGDPEGEVDGVVSRGIRDGGLCSVGEPGLPTMGLVSGTDCCCVIAETLIALGSVGWGLLSLLLAAGRGDFSRLAAVNKDGVPLLREGDFAVSDLSLGSKASNSTVSLSKCGMDKVVLTPTDTVDTCFSFSVCDVSSTPRSRFSFSNLSSSAEMATFFVLGFSTLGSVAITPISRTFGCNENFFRNYKHKFYY